jgi:hypothetical protein
MRSRQLLVYETDGRIAELLRKEGREHSWAIREPRRLENCLRLLGKGGQSVVVCKLGRDLPRELKWLEAATWLFPEIAVIVVGDRMAPTLGELVWDLGARLVFLSLPPGRRLVEVVAAFLDDAGALVRDVAAPPDTAANRDSSQIKP